MGPTVSYMGTKRQLARHVAELVDSCKPGPFLDAFSGMCSVGSAVAPRRQIWSNDLQLFSYTVAAAKFCSQDILENELEILDLCSHIYQDNLKWLKASFKKKLARETTALGISDYRELSAILDENTIAANEITKSEKKDDYDVFTKRYAGSYFSTVQCAEIDSIRKAIESNRNQNKISSDQKNWLLVGLCMAASKCSTTTGHFAQPLRPNRNNIKRYVAQRKRRIYYEWIAAFRGLTPVGSKKWRKKNRAFMRDANDLLLDLSTGPLPSVIYADPPYTKDQYSRYYHIYETIILYDRPIATNRGLYREDRAVSKYCHKTEIEESLDSLIKAAANMSCDVLLSYPESGLMKNSIEIITSIIRRSYGKSPVIMEFDHHHSTMGASKYGIAKSGVKERIYMVKS